MMNSEDIINKDSTDTNAWKHQVFQVHRNLVVNFMWSNDKYNKFSAILTHWHLASFVASAHSSSPMIWTWIVVVYLIWPIFAHFSTIFAHCSMGFTQSQSTMVQSLWWSTILAQNWPRSKCSHSIFRQMNSLTKRQSKRPSIFLWIGWPWKGATPLMSQSFWISTPIGQFSTNFPWQSNRY